MFGEWIHKLKEKLNRMKDDDSGSAFVFVVIGVTALMIIGATVMSLATNYVVAVIVDQYTTENFYETEGSVAEIRSGLEEICGEANEYAYMEVINNYNAKPTSTPAALDETLSSTMSTKKEKYAVKYLTGIVSLLTNSGINKLDNSVNLADNKNKWDGKNQDEADWASFDMKPVIKKMVTKPETVGSTYGGDVLHYGFRVVKNTTTKTSEMFLVISGLKIDYTDEAGYRTVVQTDIEIGVPDYGFEGNATFDELKKYIVICDDKLAVSNNGLAPGSPGIDFIGNVYAAGAKDGGKYTTGIDIISQTKNVNFNSDMIISRGDFTVNDKSQVSISKSDGELWLRNILLPDAGAVSTPAPGASYTSTQFDMSTNAYILDDLSIDNRNSVVNLGGKYYGYSYNVDNDVAKSDATSAEYSSAILVNGMNTTLKTDGLKKLILAGRTFVSRFDDSSADPSTLAEPDIMMGESLAVKSNQIAYLVPDEYILSNGQGHNPLLASEITGNDYMAAVNQVALVQALGDYLDTAKPVTANFNNKGGYVFLYLNFKNQKKANEYFSAFYTDQDNKEMLRDRAETYISTTDNDGMKLGAQLYLIAGNIIHNYYAASGEPAKQEANYFDGAGNPNAAMLRDGQTKMKNYLGKQLSLVNSGYTSDMKLTEPDGSEKPICRYELLPDSLKSELVKDRIIDFDAVNADSGIMPVIRDNTAAGGTLYITPGDYTVDGTIDKGLIISGGDVTVNRSFEGLIIAKGTVSVNGSNIKLKSNLMMVGALLEMARNDASLSKYFIGLKTLDKRSVNVAECIRYENWERDNETQLKASASAAP